MGAEPEVRRFINLVGWQEEPVPSAIQLRGHRAVREAQANLAPEETFSRGDSLKSGLWGSAMGRAGFQLSPLTRPGKEWRVAFSWLRSVGLNHLGVRDSFETTKITGLSPWENTCITFLHRILGVHESPKVHPWFLSLVRISPIDMETEPLPGRFLLRTGDPLPGGKLPIREAAGLSLPLPAQAGSIWEVLPGTGPHTCC